jgi:hypothetical protein
LFELKHGGCTHDLIGRAEDGRHPLRLRGQSAGKRCGGHDKKVRERRWRKEGRYLIALAHEGTMGSGSLSLIGSSWASADGFRRSVR